METDLNFAAPQSDESNIFDVRLGAGGRKGWSIEVRSWILITRLPEICLCKLKEETRLSVSFEERRGWLQRG